MEKVKIYVSRFERKNNSFIVRLEDDRIGYIPKEEMSIYPFKKSNAQLSTYLGNLLQAVITKEDGKNIYLSRKPVMQERINEILDGGAIGKTLDVKVISSSDVALYLDLGEMVSGIIYKNDIISASFKYPTDIYPIGSTIKAKIISYKDNMFTLSHKELYSNKIDQYYTGMRLNGIIRAPIFDNGAITGYFVQITPAISGIVDVHDIRLENGDVIPMVVKNIKPKGLKLRIEYPN